MKLFVTKKEGEPGNVFAGVWNCVVILTIITAIIWLILELGDVV